jgi:hypothetical protein
MPEKGPISASNKNIRVRDRSGYLVARIARPEGHALIKTLLKRFENRMMINFRIVFFYPSDFISLRLTKPPSLEKREGTYKMINSFF